MRKFALVSFWLMLMAIVSAVGASGSVLSDPDIPDGEQIVWSITNKSGKRSFTTITWIVKDRNGKPVYEITEDSGERKQAKYIVSKSDMLLMKAEILRTTGKGKFKADIEVKDGRQYLTYTHGKKSKDKKIKHYPDGYNGVILPFCLRGFPFGEQKEVKLRLTPPCKPETPLWAWKMWKSYVKFLGTEKVTVPAGTFDCYKLEMGASGGLVKRVTSKYRFWYAKEPPHQFVKYQDEDGKNVTELVEIKPI